MPSPRILPPIPQPLFHRLGRRHRVERFGVEGTTDPFQQVLVLLVVRVLDGFDEIRIAPNAAAIFRRAGSLTFDAKGVLLPRLLFRAAFDQNLVIPGIAEVVFVKEPEFPGSWRDDVAQARGRRILVAELVEIVTDQYGVAVKLLADLEVVQVRVFPSHRRLDMFVQLVKSAVLDLDAPPDRRLRLPERDLELIQEVGGLFPFPSLFGHDEIRSEAFNHFLGDEEHCHFLISTG